MRRAAPGWFVWSRLLILSGALCGLSSVTLGQGGKPAALQDGNTIVRKMVATYQSAQTFQETSEAKISILGKGEYFQSSTLKFKRPNLVWFETQDPQTGTLISVCNGRTVTVYSGLQNIFAKYTTSADLPGTLSSIEKASRDKLNIDAAQMLNPVTFLRAKQMPVEAKAFRYGGEQTVNGHKALMVKADADMDWIHSLPAPYGKVTFMPIERNVTFWIDPQSYLLMKASLHLLWKGAIEANGKPTGRMISLGLSFEEMHRNPALNAPFKDEDFRFIPPKGALEKFQEGH